MSKDVRRQQVSRRHVLAASLAAAGGVAGRAGVGLGAADPGNAPAPTGRKPGQAQAPRMRIAEMLSPRMGPLERLAQQCGVKYVVGGLVAAPGEAPWSLKSLERQRDFFEENGFTLEVIERRPPMLKTQLGLPGRDQEIEVVCELIRNMGKVGIPVYCYEWMALGVRRTSWTLPSRGGATVTGYDLSQEKNLGLTEHGVVKDEQVWDALKYFLDRVLPVAEKAGVKLAMHPDDPPLSPIRGVARIMSSVENFQRLVDLVPSPMNGIALCQGNFTLMTDDLPGVIRQFGRQKKIFFVHFRDVRGTPAKFEETFHDNGKTDMAACMRAYRDIGFDGVCRPDHVPKMEADRSDRRGYSEIGSLFPHGYIKGLMDAVYSE